MPAMAKAAGLELTKHVENGTKRRARFLIFLSGVGDGGQGYCKKGSMGFEPWPVVRFYEVKAP
jgi:hypothetical protein